MNASEARSSSIVLFENGRDVLVCPQDNDKFVLTAENAVRACRAWSQSQLFSVQFRDLLAKLSGWVHVNRDRIYSAQLNIRANDILFVVMQNQVRRDDVMSESLTDLDIEIANSTEFDLITFNVLALPRVEAESAAAFLSSGEILTHAQ